MTGAFTARRLSTGGPVKPLLNIGAMPGRRHADGGCLPRGLQSVPGGGSGPRSGWCGQARSGVSPVRRSWGRNGHTAGRLIRSPRPIEVRFGTSRAGAVALCTTVSVDAVVTARPEADGKQPRAVEKGRRSPLAALRPAPAAASAEASRCLPPAAPHAVQKAARGAAFSCGPLRPARSPVPTAGGRVRFRRSGSSALPRGTAGAEGAGGVLEEAGEADGVEREFLPSAERDVQRDVGAGGEGVPGQAVGQRAERLVQVVHRLRTGELDAGGEGGVGGCGEGQQSGRPGERPGAAHGVGGGCAGAGTGRATGCPADPGWWSLLWCVSCGRWRAFRGLRPSGGPIRPTRWREDFGARSARRAGRRAGPSCARTCPASCGASAAGGLGVALAAPVRVVDADLVPGLPTLQAGQGVHPHRDGDAPDGSGERLAAVEVSACSLSGPVGAPSLP